MQNFFNATELQRNPSTVFNNVQKLGQVTIAPRGREPMYLITSEQLEKIKLAAYLNGCKEVEEELKQQEPN